MIRDNCTEDMELRPCAWAMHIIFRALLIKQLYGWKRCQYGRLCSALPLEVSFGGGKSRRVFPIQETVGHFIFNSKDLCMIGISHLYRWQTKIKNIKLILCCYCSKSI